MTTAEIFDAICVRFDPKLSRFRERVLYSSPDFTPVNHYTDSDVRSMEAIIMRTLEDLVTKERCARFSPVAPHRETRIETKPDDMDAFLGISGKL